MSSADSVNGHWLEEYRRVQDRLPGTRVPWLAELRRAGLEHFAATGLPTLRDEAWKYTDVRSIRNVRFHHADGGDNTDAGAMQTHPAGEFPAYRLVFFDGHFMPQMSDLDSLPAGVTIASLAQVMNERPDVLSEHLGRYADDRTHGFVALNAAFMRDGAFIYLPPGAELDRPIQLLFVATGAVNEAIHVRNLIVAERHSSAVLVEGYAAAGDAAYLNNTVTEIVTGSNAQIEHYKVQRDSEQAFHIGGVHVYQRRDSRYTSHSIALGGRLVRNDVRAVLDAEGIECTLNGLYLTHGRQHVDNHTWIEHRKPHSTSREWYKGVLDGRSRGVFSGRVVVHPHAQLSDAAQSNHNLLLSRDAEADSRPQLEIYADDVKCAHGSTVGQLDHDALFYLRSRGLGEALARGLLVYAFAADVLDRMQLAPVRAQVHHALVGRLGGNRALENLQ